MYHFISFWHSDETANSQCGIVRVISRRSEKYIHTNSLVAYEENFNKTRTLDTELRLFNLQLFTPSPALMADKYSEKHFLPNILQ